jgi:hypothetical protein
VSFYRVELTKDAGACDHCGRGHYWDVVHDENGEPIAESTSYHDKGDAEDVCAMLNAAFELGAQSASRSRAALTSSFA